MSFVEHTCETAYIIYIYYMYIHQYNEHVNILYIDPMIQPPTIQIHILIWETVENQIVQFPMYCPKVLLKSEDQQSGLVCSINELLACMFFPMKISENNVTWIILGMYT